DRAVEDAQDLPEGDAVGGDEQVITAEPAAPALHDAVALEFEQDLLEEFARDLLVGGDLADHERLLAPRQRHQRMEGVFGSLWDHGRSSLELCQGGINTEAARPDGNLAGNLREMGGHLDLDAVAMAVDFEV